METAKSFGAIGDGITDDTVAVQAWLDAGGYRLEDGVYRAGPLTMNGNGRTFHTEGARLLAATQDMAMLTVPGDDCIVAGHLDGNSMAAIGVDVTGARALIENSTIRDIRASNVQDARAIDVTTAGGVTVKNNRIFRTHNAKLGGFCRAVAVNSTTAATGDTIVADNHIDGVTGSEGDAIQILFNNGGDVFLDSRAFIEQNKIRNASRRFIKVQGSNAVVHGNGLRYDMAAPALPSNCIDVFQSDDVSVTGNDIGEGLLATPISVTGTALRRNKGIVVWNNVIRQAATRDIASIYLEHLEDSACLENIAFGGGHVVTSGNCVNVLIDQPIGFGGVASRQVARGTSSNVSVIVRGAANMNKARANPVQLDGTGHKAELNLSA